MPRVPRGRCKFAPRFSVGNGSGIPQSPGGPAHNPHSPGRTAIQPHVTRAGETAQINPAPSARGARSKMPRVPQGRCKFAPRFKLGSAMKDNARHAGTPEIALHHRAGGAVQSSPALQRGEAEPGQPESRRAGAECPGTHLLPRPDRHSSRPFQPRIARRTTNDIKRQRGPHKSKNCQPPRLPTKVTRSDNTPLTHPPTPNKVGAFDPSNLIS
jgi:hypothetical protein